MEGRDLSHRMIYVRISSGEDNNCDDESFEETTLQLPLTTQISELTLIVAAIQSSSADIPPLLSFFHEQLEVTGTLESFIAARLPGFSTEETLSLKFKSRQQQPSLSSIDILNLEGHEDSVLDVSFSRTGRFLVSASGDTTVRFWDVSQRTCIGHSTRQVNQKSWVLVVQWSAAAEGERVIAAGNMLGEIMLYNAITSEKIGKTIKAHTSWITSLAWQPLHLNIGQTSLASASNDGTVKLWNVLSQTCMLSLKAHTATVTKILWGGENLIFTASKDQLLKVWRHDGSMVGMLRGHMKSVNSMSTSTEGYLRALSFPETSEDPAKTLSDSYKAFKGGSCERLISGSEDSSLILWDPSKQVRLSKRPLKGHSDAVNHVVFSPDGRKIASASFDMTVRLWDGLSGESLGVFIGHTGRVYQLSWSPNSSHFVSASKDCTVRLWRVEEEEKLSTTLLVEHSSIIATHSDQVFAVDWCPTATAGDGTHLIASGGKDKVLLLSKIDIK